MHQTQFSEKKNPIHRVLPNPVTFEESSESEASCQSEDSDEEQEVPIP